MRDRKFKNQTAPRGSSEVGPASPEQRADTGSTLQFQRSVSSLTKSVLARQCWDLSDEANVGLLLAQRSLYGPAGVCLGPRRPDVSERGGGAWDTERSQAGNVATRKMDRETMR